MPCGCHHHDVEEFYVDEYYICSPKHSQGQNVRTFWREQGNGYTINLDEAGLFNKHYYPDYPVVTKENASDWGKYDHFLIHMNDLHLIGKVMTCVQN